MLRSARSAAPADFKGQSPLFRFRVSNLVSGQEKQNEDHDPKPETRNPKLKIQNCLANPGQRMRRERYRAITDGTHSSSRARG